MKLHSIDQGTHQHILIQQYKTQLVTWWGQYQVHGSAHGAHESVHAPLHLLCTHCTTHAQVQGGHVEPPWQALPQV